MRKLTACFIAAGLFALAACSSGPLRSFGAGDELESYDFSEANTFEEGAYTAATLRIIDGIYRISMSQGDSEVWWAQWGESLDDVIVDVETTQISEANENAYGVACRLQGQVSRLVRSDEDLFALTPAEATAEATEDAADEATEEAAAPLDEPEGAGEVSAANGDGYLFMIRGNGSFAIMRAHDRQINTLVNWTQSDLIHQGAAQNQLRAVCMGDYLALYINGEFAGNATDDSYSTGQVGLAASASGRLGAVIEFDNLTVSEAEAA